MRKFFFLLFSLALLSGACREAGRNEEPALEPALQAENTDEGLAAISAQAQETLPEFFIRLGKPAGGESQFMVKCPFPADPGSGYGKEYLWLQNIRFRDGVYSAEVSNRPFYIEGLEAGSTVAFSLDDVADWMYVRDGRIEGGLSIKYLIERIPELDRDREMDSLLKLFE